MAITEAIDDAGIALLTMEHPPVNALTISDAFHLADLLDGYKRNEDVRVVILTAVGRGFCAGVDIKEMQALDANEGILEANRSCFELFRSVYQCAVPVIAAVNDFCLGTGIGIVGNADIIVAAEKAVFGLPEVDNGALGAATHLSRLVPQHRARHMLYTAQPAPATELATYGSVLKVTSDETLLEEAHEVAATIADKRPRVMRAAKASMNGIDTVDVTKSYRFEQGFTYELNLLGEGDRARDAFLDRSETPSPEEMDG